MDFLERAVPFQRFYYRDIPELDFTAYHSGRCKKPCPFQLTRKSISIFLSCKSFHLPFHYILPCFVLCLCDL